MFICQNCRKPSQPKEKKGTVTIKKRVQTYYNYKIEYRREPRYISSPNKEVVQEYIKKGWKVIRQSISKGSEIAEEINVCTKCHKQLTKDTE